MAALALGGYGTNSDDSKMRGNLYFSCSVTAYTGEPLKDITAIVI